MSPVLGKIADKYSFASSMTLAFGFAAVSFLGIAFTTPETRWVYLVYISMYSFAMAGINSGVINLIYDYVNPKDRAVAMGVKNAVGGIIAFFIALIAGLILSAIQKAGGFVIFGIRLYAQQFLAIISFSITLLLIVYMRKVIAPIKKVSSFSNFSRASGRINPSKYSPYISLSNNNTFLSINTSVNISISQNLNKIKLKKNLNIFTLCILHIEKKRKI